MGLLSDKINYIKGMADALKLGEKDTDEAKILGAMIELLDDMAFEVEGLGEEQDLISEDLGDCEDAIDDIYDIIDEECDCCCDDDCDCCDDDCDCCTFQPVVCPACNAEIELDDDIISDDCSYFICPNCKEKIDIDWEDDECECGCDCCHDED